jgi:hypothetical protein
MRHTSRIIIAAVLIVLSSGCNLSMRQPTPTAAPNAPLITTLPPDVNLPPQPTSIIPVTPANPDCLTTPIGWIPYTVEPGDSLGLLAEQTSSTIDELVVGNCLDNPDALFVGQVIYLPSQPVISP